MDSHAFSEPELVPPREREAGGGGGGGGGEETRHLTWRVHVLRRGVPEPVDTLVVNSTTLPPRKNRAGKVVWRLPEDPSHVPKFGVHEQKRLWDLFKEQKKQRRKDKSSSSSGRHDDANSNSNPSGGGGEADGGDHGDGDSSTLSGGAEGREASPGGTRQSSLGNQHLETVGTTGAINGHSHPVSPPPGFGGTPGIETLTIQETYKQRINTHETLQPLPASPPTINPPPGLGNTAAVPLTSSPAPLNWHLSLYGNGAPALSSVVSAQSPSGGTVASTVPSGPQTPSYFSLPDVSPSFPQNLAGLVAHAFQTLISVSGSPHGVSEWLSYYAPAAQSTLIMGTAQAVALTHDERRRQWQGLSASSDVGPTGDADADGVGANVGVGGKRWECRGWTAQWVDRGATDVATVAKWPNDVLVVLSGRTLQQHLLSFHLTLLLQHQQMPQGSQPSRPAYQISNEILALALLT